jgi:hypothetical protein
MATRDQQAVFTIKQVVYERKPILYVVHDKEGDWQFLSDSDVRVSDAMIVTMSEILDLDPSLEKVLWIPEGTEARRESVNGEWVTSIYIRAVEQIL